MEKRAKAGDMGDIELYNLCEKKQTMGELISFTVKMTLWRKRRVITANTFNDKE